MKHLQNFKALRYSSNGVTTPVVVVCGVLDNREMTMAVPIMSGKCYVHITKAQAMEFFGLVEPEAKPSSMDYGGGPFYEDRMEQTMKEAVHEHGMTPEPKKQLTLGELWDKFESIDRTVKAIEKTHSEYIAHIRAHNDASHILVAERLQHQRAHLVKLRAELVSL